jgi:hypothetical protein
LHSLIDHYRWLGASYVIVGMLHHKMLNEGVPPEPMEVEVSHGFLGTSPEFEHASLDITKQ